MPGLLPWQKFKAPDLLLLLLIITYTIYFSWYTLNRHNTLNSYAADLSLIDQPMWNTVRGPGGFMELTWGDRQQPRWAEHVELILLPLSLLFFLWADVRILLIAQSVALALGALPVFWIARDQLSMLNQPVIRNSDQGSRNPFPTSSPKAIAQASPAPAWAALAFALVYLLFPQLQAANVADFHADPFVVAPLLFAFWYASQKRWGWMWLWAIVVMATKETLPTLTAMLGVWLLVRAYNQGRMKRMSGDLRPDNLASSNHQSPVSFNPEVRHGLGLILISTLWFVIATFLIVAPLARQYFGTDGPIYLANRYKGLTDLLTLLQDPARWRYLPGLLLVVGFLPLLAPELLGLGLPVLMANLLSNFPGQYSGEQHYSAPLVAVLVLAAIYGTRRLLAQVSPGKKSEITLIAVILWLLIWSLGYHARHGWTPLSTRMEHYAFRPAAAHLAGLTAQIPPEAPVSASAAIHPHLAHRRVIYVFPTVQEADYLLVDVTDIPGVHPNDAHAKIMTMLATNWRILQAEQGLLLAQENSHLASAKSSFSSSQLPASFFDFARAKMSPTYPTDLSFGQDQLRLVGYDVHDDPDNGVTFRFYWQASTELPETLRLWPLVYDDRGQLLTDPTQVPMVAAVWYPPAAWQVGEIVVTETLPQLLPKTFHLGIAAGPEDSFADSSQRFPITIHRDKTVRLQLGHWAQLATFQRQGPFLKHLPAILTMQPLTSVTASFDQVIRLTGFWLGDTNLHPGATLPILLEWTAKAIPPVNFTVFIHLLAPDGSLVAQSDAYPTWLTPQPTSQWPLNQTILDSHQLTLPPTLPPGTYTLQLGLYQAQTLERLSLADGKNTLALGQIQVK